MLNPCKFEPSTLLLKITTMLHLWEMDTHWFLKNKHDHIESTFPYKSWKDFLECKPYKLWKPYILSSWCWKTIYLKDYEAQRRNNIDKTLMDSGHLLRLTSVSHSTPSPFGNPQDAKEVDMLQIVFLSPDRFTGVHRVEIILQKEDEAAVKDWLLRHMPTFWKLE